MCNDEKRTSIVFLGDEEMGNVMIEDTANINLADSEGMTSPHFGAYKGIFDVSE